MPSVLDSAITPLGGAFAARVDGLQLRAVDAGQRAGRRAAVAPWPSTRCWCSPVSTSARTSWSRPAGCSATLTLAHPVMPPIDAEHPEVLEIDATRSRTDPRYRDEWENDTWHTDVSFMPDPPLGSLLAGVVIPPVGGDTAFADLQAAYDALSAPVRALVDGLEAEHDGRAEFAEHLRERPEGGSWSGRRFTVLEPVVHPVVRVHPETGRRGLFVNPTFTTRDRRASRAPRATRCCACSTRCATAPEHTYRHRWTDGRRGRLGQPGHAPPRRARLRRRPPRAAPGHHRGRPPGRAPLISRPAQGVAGSERGGRSPTLSGIRPGSALELPSKPPACSISTWAQPWTAWSTSQVRRRPASSGAPAS